MVVLAASVTTKNGKILVSRQFVPMTRIRIEGLLAAFPKLLTSGKEGSQHTFIETENVRYIYQPVESLYVLLITNKHSNIKEDLDTLHLTAKMIPEYCNGHDEDSVEKNAFQLIFALDELISSGYKDHEEKLQNIIRESKENEQKQQMKLKAMQLEQKRIETRHMASLSSGAPSGIGSMDDQGSHYVAPSSQIHGSLNYAEEPTRSFRREGAAKKGMELRAKKNEDNLFAELGVGSSSILDDPITGMVSQDAYEGKLDTQRYRPVHISVVEKMDVELDRDGIVQKFEIKGEIKVTVSDPDFANLLIRMQLLENGIPLKFSPSPRIDKVAWKENLIQMKKGKSYPIGRDNALEVLRWRITEAEEDLLPLQVSVWPTSENGRSIVSAEFASTGDDASTLQNVWISIPCKTRVEPIIQLVEVGECAFDSSTNCIAWHIPEIKSDESGTIEFSIPEINADHFFPVNVTFSSDALFAGIHVAEIKNSDGSPIDDFDLDSMLVVNKYEIS